MKTAQAALWDETRQADGVRRALMAAPPPPPLEIDLSEWLDEYDAWWRRARALALGLPEWNA